MADPDRVLVIKLGALGDIVLATGPVRRIVTAFPDARVTLLTAPAGRELFQGIAGLEVIAFRRRGVIEMGRLLAWLRRRRFGVVFDLQGSTRSAVLTRASGAPRRIGLHPGIAYTHAVAGVPAVRHPFDRLNALLASQGIAAADPREGLPVPAAAVGAVHAWLEEHGLAPAQAVLLHAGASARWPSKRWEASRYAELAHRLEARGCRIVWIGADADAAVNRELAAGVGIDATGRFRFPELVALAQQARFAVVNDSAPMHALAAGGLPVYALFGPTDWRRSHAVGQEQHVLYQPVDCSPCYRPVCPPRHAHACLSGITPARVIERLERDGRL